MTAASIRDAAAAHHGAPALAADNGNNAAESLARSHLLRLQAAELVAGARLRVGADGAADAEACWAPAARAYLKRVRSVLDGLGPAPLGPAAARLPDGRLRVPLLSDKFTKSLADGAGDAGANPLTAWSFPFAGGSSLSLSPVGSFGHAGNAGLAGRHANGNVVPTLDVAVLVRPGGKEGEAFAGGKDYLNHSYTDKRNLLAVHVAQELSRKHHRADIGTVHLTHAFGDARKVGLLLTPPSDASRSSPPRFRLRLLFGVALDPPSSSDNSKHSGDDVSEDGDDTYAAWVPRSRLLPNRSNNRPAKQNDEDSGRDICGTPHYTNAIAEDLHLLSTTALVNATLAEFAPDSDSCSLFHDILLLLKVWALQRGFLRGHDTFTTTTLALLLVYLYRTKAIGRRMGAVQGFTAFVKFWSERDWLGEDHASTGGKGAPATQKAATQAEELRRKVQRKAAHVIPAEGRSEAQTAATCAQARLYLADVRGTGAAASDAPATLLECYRQAYAAAPSSPSHRDAPVLLDPAMTVNYLARLSPGFVRESRLEARAALDLVHGRDGGNGGGREAFRRLFLETRRFWTRYDAYARVPLAPAPAPRHGETWGADADDLGRDEALRRGVAEVLARALGDRVVGLRLLTGGNGDVRGGGGDDGEAAAGAIADGDQGYAAPVRGAGVGYAARPGARVPDAPVPAAAGEDPCLVVGLRLDPAAARRIVDRGPPAEDAEGSAAFVALWGEARAQLRRFQDGAIVRATVWNDATMATGSSGSKGGTEEQGMHLHGMDRSNGGVVERIACHIVRRHFTDRSKLLQPEKKRKKDAIRVPSLPVEFTLRNMLSFIDGVAPPLSSPTSSSGFADSLALHKNVMSAFDSLSKFLRENTATSSLDMDRGKTPKPSNLGLPLRVDEVEPLSPCLRYSALFPPVPHPLLGGGDGTVGCIESSSKHKRKVSGVNVGSPILIQLRFEGSSAWPASLDAMSAAKCAMLVTLADGIDRMKLNQQQQGGGNNSTMKEELDAFDGPMDVTPNYLDLGYRGYSWRIILRADQELRMLRGLRDPTLEARELQSSLIDRHVRRAMHHSLVHAVHTRYPSSSSVVRLAHRWVASHMLSDQPTLEAIELMVAKTYTEAEGSIDGVERFPGGIGRVDVPPSTVVAGFLKFLQLLSTHDWAREPLIVDPQNHISAHDRALIHSQFQHCRGPDFCKGPPMYIISPTDYDSVEAMIGLKVVGDSASQQPTSGKEADKVWAPTVTMKFPERVVLSRVVALAERSHNYMLSCIRSGDRGDKWAAAFRESAATLTSYSALLRVNPSFVIDTGCSSTGTDSTTAGAVSKSQGGHGMQPSPPSTPFERSMERRYAGPKELRKKFYKNLVLEKDTLHEWQPVKMLVQALRSRYNSYAVFFYNEFTPDVVAVIWRPDAFKPKPFTATVSEFQRPVMEPWKDDSLVVSNIDDLMAEIRHFSKNIISHVKVFDDMKPNNTSQAEGKRKKKNQKEYREDVSGNESNKDSKRKRK